MKSTYTMIELLQAFCCRSEGHNFTYRYLNGFLPERCTFRSTFGNRLHYEFMKKQLCNLPVQNLIIIERMNSYSISFEIDSKDIKS